MAISSKMVHIAALMMLKNEEKRLPFTLASLKCQIDSIVVYDTGSTDNTLSILHQFSKEHNIPLRLKKGDFVDFATSRNVALDFADTFMDIDFLLLLDCNDELQGGKSLRSFCEKELSDPKYSCYMVVQKWKNSGSSTITYRNTRLQKPRHDWRYRGPVHEYITRTKGAKLMKNTPEDIIIYQDRTVDDNKTALRLKRDKDVLIKDLDRDPTDPRTYFYLAQTYDGLGEIDNSYKYYEYRYNLHGGFYEERFVSAIRLGNIAANVYDDWHSGLVWFHKALEIMPRVEPYIYMTRYYVSKKNWNLAYPYIYMACLLSENTGCVLFVETGWYQYDRYHLLANVAFQLKRYSEALDACHKAIKARNEPRDINLLKQIEAVYKPTPTMKNGFQDQVI